MSLPAKYLPIANRYSAILSALSSHKSLLGVRRHSSAGDKNGKEVKVNYYLISIQSNLFTPRGHSIRQLPDPPDTCCMSNCANCVWIQYAQELEKLFADGGETAKRLIIEKMDDPSMRAFLSLELTMAIRQRMDNGNNGGKDKS